MNLLQSLFVTFLIFFHSDCFPKNYTEIEVADATANILEHAPERKDRGDCKKEVLWEDLNESDEDDWDEEDKFEKEKKKCWAEKVTVVVTVTCNNW